MEAKAEIPRQSDVSPKELSGTHVDTAQQGAAEFDDRELGEHGADHHDGHHDAEPTGARKEGSARAAEFDDRELDEAEAKELEGHSEASDAPPPRRLSVGSVLNAIEEKEKELKELEARENSVEVQLQVYSEVIGLRKELQVVKKETERMRRQLADVDELVAK
ncbi:hypothetical protein TraAM80_10454, partial [Trypanosoma rangeli]